MPDHLWLPPSVQVALKELPAGVRLVVRLVIFNLLDDPFPPESQAYLDAETGQKLPYVRLVDVPADEATVRLYYTVDGEHLAIQLLEIRVK